MIWLLIYVAACIAIGVVFGVLAWDNDDDGNAPIVMASILVAFVWPLIIPAWIYIEIVDRFAERRFNRRLQKIRARQRDADEPGTDSTRGRSADDR